MPPLKNTPGASPASTDDALRPISTGDVPRPIEALDRVELEEGADNSPAAALQWLLADDMDRDQADASRAANGQWTARTTIWFSLGVGLLLWAAIAVGLYLLS